MVSPTSGPPYALRRLCFVCTIFYICLFSLTAASWMPRRREQLWRDRLWLYYLAALPPVFAVGRCVLLHRNPVPFATIDVFDPLVYGPMTLLILGFTEAASRRREQRAFYSTAAIFVILIVLAEVGWSAHGAMTCGEVSACNAKQETVQLYFYIGWAVVDCLVTAGFVHLLYKSLATLRKARWHIAALGVRSLAIVVLAVIGLSNKSRLTREAQVDIAMATSVLFLVVRAFGSLVFSAQATSIVYPSQRKDNSGQRTKGSMAGIRSEPSNSSQQHINVAEDKFASEDVDGDIELDVMGRGSSRSVERSGSLR